MKSRIITDWFTGPDGKTHDPARGLWVLGIVVFLSFSAYTIYKTGAFDMINFGLAYSALLGGGAAGVKIKETSEPKERPGIDSDDDPSLKPPKG